jgi:ankyrin repeat protein
MIEQATARRLAGDWPGACAAAHVDPAFTMTEVAERYGAQTAARLAEDLTHLAPDLVRWHLPRHLDGRSTLRPNQCAVLAWYGEHLVHRPCLYVTTPAMVDGPQRLRLRFDAMDDQRMPAIAYAKSYWWMSGQIQDWRMARHLWDARQAGGLLERCCDGTRVPFRNADGTPRDAGELPARDPGPADPAGHAEWVSALWDRGDIRPAIEAAGITLDETPPQTGYYEPPPLLGVLAKGRLALTRLEPEIRRLAAADFGDRFQIRTGRDRAVIQLELDRDTPGLRVRLVPGRDGDYVRPLPEALWRRLPDLDLLQFGDIAPEELHPLVSASLFPARARHPADGPPDPACRPLPAVRVRCRGEWHEVRQLAGGLRLQHTVEEERRERAMRALGGPVTGCFAVQQAWTSGTGWLPKTLREQRREFFSRVQHGDTAEVIRLLETGTDPRIRDGRKRTLLHLLHLLDHETMLPRLLQAGLDLEARDHHQRTPLHVAVGEGPEALVRALLAAGARTDVADDGDRSLPYVILHHRRRELRFLYDTVVRDHPKLADQLYYSWEDLDDWEGQDDD